MAIRVRHDMGPAAAAAASAASGAARRQQEAARLLQARGTQLTQGRGAGASGAPGAHAPSPQAHAPAPVNWTMERDRREDEANHRVHELNLQAEARGAEQAAAREFSAGQAEADRAWRGEQAAAEADRRREEFDYRLTGRQRAELDRINDALDEARRSGRFSGAEMAELERQADAMRAGIRPLPAPREEPPRPVFHTDETGRRWVQNGRGGWDPVQPPAPAPQSAEEVYAATKVDERGRRWGLDRNGRLYEVGGGGEDEFAALLKLAPETRSETRVDPATGKAETVEVPLTVDERLVEMEKIRRMRDRFNAREAAPPPAPGESGAATGPGPAAPPPDATQAEKTEWAKKRWGRKR